MFTQSEQTIFKIIAHFPSEYEHKIERMTHFYLFSYMAKFEGHEHLSYAPNL